MHKQCQLTLLFLFVLLLPQIGLAQSRLATDDKKALKYYAEAGAFFRRAQFREVTEVLSKAIDRDDQFVEAYLMSADAFDRMRDGSKALIIRQRLVESVPNHPKTINTYFQVGQALFENGEYAKARDLMETFLKIAVDRPEEFKKAQQTLLSIEFAIKALQNPVEFDPSALPPQVNQFALQYFPAVTVDENTLIYTARRGLEPYYDEDVYIVEKDENDNWGLPSGITNLINTDNNEGACTISADGRTIIFTACQGRKGLGSCDLYVSSKRGDEWGEPVNMGSPINSSAWESQPSLSADGRTLFFASNRAGGYGKRDIWVTTKGGGGAWNDPINLGDKINTPEDDISPFIHFNGQDLYFSSIGHVGMGGFDLYKSKMMDNSWNAVTNLGYPINDHEDQVSLFITAEGSLAYYANEVSRNGRIMSSEINQFELPSSARIEHRSNFLTGIVTDSETGKPLESQLKVYDVNTNDLVSEVYSDPLTGEYFVVLTEGKEYAIAINRPGYLFQNLSYDYLKKEGLDPERLDIALDPIVVGAQTVLKNIFFKTNEYELQDKSETQLATVIQFLKNNPRLAVDVSGHTDNTGDDSFNNELSLNRARSVYDYLIAQGILPQRLEFSGYGSVQPVADNSSEKGKALNRRIEFKIIRM